MQINFNIPILNIDGEPELDPKENPVDLAFMAINVLNARFKDEENLPFDQQLERGLLLLRIKQSQKDFVPLDVTPEEVSLIKKLIGKAGFPNLTVARACAILNQEDAVPKPLPRATNGANKAVPKAKRVIPMNDAKAP